jgi:transposase InsO family protein
MPMGPDERWSLDFVSDQLTDGRRFRILTVVGNCTRECLALVDETSLSGARVARKTGAAGERGKPKMVASDNGSEFTSNAIVTWADQSRVKGPMLKSFDFCLPTKSTIVPDGSGLAPRSEVRWLPDLERPQH